MLSLAIKRLFFSTTHQILFKLSNNLPLELIVDLAIGGHVTVCVFCVEDMTFGLFLEHLV